MPSNHACQLKASLIGYNKERHNSDLQTMTNYKFVVLVGLGLQFCQSCQNTNKNRLSISTPGPYFKGKLPWDYRGDTTANFSTCANKKQFFADDLFLSTCQIPPLPFIQRFTESVKQPMFCSSHNESFALQPFNPAAIQISHEPTNAIPDKNQI